LAHYCGLAGGHRQAVQSPPPSLYRRQTCGF
jgi:hypothetical protein